MTNYVKFYELLEQYFTDLGIDFVDAHDWIGEIMDEEVKPEIIEAGYHTLAKIAMEQAIAAFEAQESLNTES